MLEENRLPSLVFIIFGDSLLSKERQKISQKTFNYRNLLMFTLGLITYMLLTLNISMTITIYKAYKLFYCKILFNLAESSYITVLKYLCRKIIEDKDAENDFFMLFYVALISNISTAILSFMSV